MSVHVLTYFAMHCCLSWTEVVSEAQQQDTALYLLGIVCMQCCCSLIPIADDDTMSG